MRVDQIWQYPVKSMLGDRVDEAQLAANGIVGDRMWALRDEERGAIASARRVAGISRLRAAKTASGSLAITLPDGAVVTSADTDVDSALTAAVGHAVKLFAKPDVSDIEHWAQGRPDNADMMVEMRAIFGRTEDEPLPDFSVFPPEMMEFEYPPGNYFDCYPLMIMTTSALQSLRAALPESAVDERRFRPSLVIDSDGAAGHPEFEWSGRNLRIGEAELNIRAACPRCVTVTRDFAPDLPADRRVLRHIVRDLDQNVGVYATVVRDGSIRVGDPVELI